jgi:hypothetical protein
MTLNKDITLTLASRQTSESRFSHFEGSKDELVQLVRENIDLAYEGYRPGVYNVPVPAASFMSGIISLEPGEELLGKFESRVEGEAPRKWLASCTRRKQPAKFCEIILYSRSTLEETPGYKASSDWEIISINASPTVEPSPMTPETLIANHFNLSGGSKTGMSPEEFEAALKTSVDWWKDKALCG